MTERDRNHVPPEVRRVEDEIDRWFTAHPLLAFGRDAALRALMRHYLAIEAHARKMLFAGARARNRALWHGSRLAEDSGRRSVFWALKWVLRSAPDGERIEPPDALVQDFVGAAGVYEVFTDAVKSAERGGSLAIRYRAEDRVIVIYEGGERTGNDWGMVENQQVQSAVALHATLTADDDQLTESWNAGQYRAACRALGGLAKDAQIQDVRMRAWMGAPPQYFGVLVQLPETVVSSHPHVIEAMTLRPEDFEGGEFWNWRDWMDVPLLNIGGKRCCPSGILMALADHGGDVHMLRLAAKRDRKQYSRVSQLREKRMIAQCEAALRAARWSIEKERPAHGDIDVLARRGEDLLALQLKSTLRPLAPTEVAARNAELRKGIQQVVAARASLARDMISVVLTDGYRGDYEIWAHARRENVPIATLFDLEEIAADPRKTKTIAAERAGLMDRASQARMDTRRYPMGNWTAEVRDEAPPE